MRYAPASSVRALLRQGRPRMEARVNAADMISVEEAASMMGERVATIRRWIAQGHCVAVNLPGVGTRMPRWQFSEEVLLWIGPMTQALGTSSGWPVLAFLETPHAGLEGRAPRQALEQGDIERVLVLAAI